MKKQVDSTFVYACPSGVNLCLFCSRDAELLAGLVDQRPMFAEVKTI